MQILIAKVAISTKDAIHSLPQKNRESNLLSRIEERVHGFSFVAGRGQGTVWRFCGTGGRAATIPGR